MKQKTLARLANEAAGLLQRIVRMKAALAAGGDLIACVTCGVRYHWKEMDGGHYVSRTHAATRLMEENIHPQCKRCNGYLRGNLTSYAIYMLEMYGAEFLKELDRLKHKTHKWSRPELLDLIAELKQQAAELERQL